MERLRSAIAADFMVALQLYQGEIEALHHRKQLRKDRGVQSCSSPVQILKTARMRRKESCANQMLSILRQLSPVRAIWQGVLGTRDPMLTSWSCTKMINFLAKTINFWHDLQHLQYMHRIWAAQCKTCIAKQPSLKRPSCCNINAHDLELLKALAQCAWRLILVSLWS